MSTTFTHPWDILEIPWNDAELVQMRYNLSLPGYIPEGCTKTFGQLREDGDIDGQADFLKCIIREKVALVRYEIEKYTQNSHYFDSRDNGALVWFLHLCDEFYDDRVSTEDVINFYTNSVEPHIYSYYMNQSSRDEVDILNEAKFDYAESIGSEDNEMVDSLSNDICSIFATLDDM